jgi:hypothetical protein
VPNSAHEGLYADSHFRTLATPPYARSAMSRFFRYLQPQLVRFLQEMPFFANGGDILRLEHLTGNNYSMWNICLEDARDSVYNPFIGDLWQYAVIQRHQPLWRWSRSIRHWARQAASAARFSRILGENRNSVAAHFFDGAGPLYIIFFDPNKDHLQQAMPAAPAAQYAAMAQLARDHDDNLRDTGSAFINLLLQAQMPVPTVNFPTPSERSLTPSSSQADRMDISVDNRSEDEPNPEITQRRSAEIDRVSQPPDSGTRFLISQPSESVTADDADLAVVSVNRGEIQAFQGAL